MPTSNFSDPQLNLIATVAQNKFPQGVSLFMNFREHIYLTKVMRVMVANELYNTNCVGEMGDE